MNLIRNVDDVLRAQSPQLPISNIDDRELENRRFYNSAAGVSHHSGNISLEAVVLPTTQVNKDMSARPTRRETLHMVNDDSISHISIRIGKEDLILEA